MAKMEDVRYLQHDDSLICITNADLDYAFQIESETLSNPPIKMDILDAKCYISGEHGDVLDIFEPTIDAPDDIVVPANLSKLIAGTLPGWRLTGVNFSLDGLWLYYVNEIPKSYRQDLDLDDRYEGIQITCGDFEYLKLQFTVDYADGMPVRRYDAEIQYLPSDHFPIRNCNVTIIEYWGKRKVRKIKYNEQQEYGIDDAMGRPCYFTEY